MFLRRSYEVPSVVVSSLSRLARPLFPLLPRPAPLQTHHPGERPGSTFLVLNHRQDDEPRGVRKPLPPPSAGLTSCYLCLHPNVSQEKSASWLGFAAPSSLRIIKKSVKSHPRGQLIFEMDLGGTVCFLPTQNSGSCHQNPIPFSKVNKSSPRVPSSTGLTRAVGHSLTSATLQDEVYSREYYFRPNFIHYSLP